MQEAFRAAIPINIEYISPYPDFFAFGITLLLTVVLCLGVKESTRFNNIFTCLNIAVVLFVTIFGFIHADFDNWSLDPSYNGTQYGEGGFFPYGADGVLSGAATCFYGFVGFDAIATSGEEARNPPEGDPHLPDGLPHHHLRRLLRRLLCPHPDGSLLPSGVKNLHFSSISFGIENIPVKRIYVDSFAIR